MQKVLYILGQLNDDDVEWLIREGVREKFPRGAVLIEQGRANTDLFFLLDGHVSVSTAASGEIDILGVGEVLGEMSLIDSRVPSATVTAKETCFVLRLEHDLLRRHVEENLGFGMRFYRALAMFLSHRLRSEQVLEFNEEIGIVEGQEQAGELDAYILDNIHQAGARFDRLLKNLMTARTD